MTLANPMPATTAHRLAALATVSATLALAGCGNLQMPGSSPAPAPAPTAAGTAKPAAAPAPATATAKVGPGMNERGEVIDSKKVEAGFGQKVKGLGDWEGEITGKPASAKFGQLKIGMSHSQVTGILGQPSDQGSYITGKAFIPFYFGSDKYRYEAVYKGQGRLIFASSATYSFGEMHLIWIIHSANESGTR